MSTDPLNAHAVLVSNPNADIQNQYVKEFSCTGKTIALAQKGYRFEAEPAGGSLTAARAFLITPAERAMLPVQIKVVNNFIDFWNRRLVLGDNVKGSLFFMSGLTGTGKSSLLRLTKQISEEVFGLTCANICIEKEWYRSESPLRVS